MKGKKAVPGMPGLYQANVDAYGTIYERSVGLGVIYLRNNTPVGYSDWWNFNPKPWGARSKSGEILSRFAYTSWGQPFWVLYGEHPPANSLHHD